MKTPCNKIFMDIESGGWKPGELVVMTAGRGTGKSMITQYFKNWHMIFDEPQPAYKILTTATVDGSQWYTVTCTRDISIWIRETFADLEDKQWFSNIDEKWMINMNTYDMHEELYTMLQLRW